MELDLERQFFHSARDYLACRLVQMGGDFRGGRHSGSSYSGMEWTIGELSCYAEMHLIIEEAKGVRDASRKKAG